MEYISFPGLGIKPFHINNIAFKIGNIGIAWYGIIICVGLILAVVYAMFRAKQEGIKSDDVIDLGLFLVLFGVIGARLYYVAFTFKDYIVRNEKGAVDVGKTLLGMINIREGGIAIYGALIAGFLTILVVAKVKKIKVFKILDFVSPACLIGQTIGRWGNFVNVEAYGSATNLPWRMGILKSNPLYDKAAEMGDWVSKEFVHPTFLYESLWNIIGFIIINAIYKKKKFDGQIFCMYISWYGFGRMFIEALRTDSLMAGPFRISQIVGFVTFIAGIVLFIILSKNKKESVAVSEGKSTIFDGGVDGSEEEDPETRETEEEPEEDPNEETSDETSDPVPETDGSSPVTEEDEVKAEDPEEITADTPEEEQEEVVDGEKDGEDN